jgi:excisionase family DNA binding protein
MTTATLPDKAAAIESEVLTATEVAHILRVSTRTATELLRSGRVPGVVRLGATDKARYRVHRKMFMEWLQAKI